MLGFEYDSRGKVLQADRSFYRNGWSDPNTGASFFGIAEPFYQVQGGNVPNARVVAAQFPGTPIDSNIPGQNFYWNPDGTLYKGTSDGSYNYKGPLIVNGLQYREIRRTPRRVAGRGHDRAERDRGLASIPFTRYATFGRARTEPDRSPRERSCRPRSARTRPARCSATTGRCRSGVRRCRTATEFTPRPSTRAATRFANYQAGGSLGLNCPAVGGCTVSQAWPTPPR